MHKTNARHKPRDPEFDLHGDLEKLKSALADTTFDVKGVAGQMLSDSYENLRSRSSDIQVNVAEYIAKKPFKSLGIALLSGVAIGFLLRHK